MLPVYKLNTAAKNQLVRNRKYFSLFNLNNEKRQKNDNRRPPPRNFRRAPPPALRAFLRTMRGGRKIRHARQRGFKPDGRARRLPAEYAGGNPGRHRNLRGRKRFAQYSRDNQPHQRRRGLAFRGTRRRRIITALARKASGRKILCVRFAPSQRQNRFAKFPPCQPAG